MQSVGSNGHSGAAVLLCAVLALASAGTGKAQDAEGFYSPRSNWTSFQGGSLNISAFVFRDLNRNGTYDVEDRPMAGIAVRLSGPGRNVVRRSNIQGFANFPMSVLDRDAPVNEPGSYLFQAYVPPGWDATTENAAQTGEFVVFPGSVADMVLKKPLMPIGLAPALTIRGTVRAALATGTANSLQVEATSPEGEMQRVPLGEDASFTLQASPGEWLVEIRGPKIAEPVQRRVRVTAAPVVISDISLDENRPAPAPIEAPVDFEGITEAAIAEVPSGVGEVGWHNMVVTNHTFYGGSGYVNNLISGNYLGYNSSAHPVTVTQPEPFDFRGGYFGTAWPRAEGEVLRLRAWRGEELIHEDEITLSSLGPIWFDADYRSVTRIELATRHYWQFVCDDLVFAVRRAFLE
ncbi:MAG TPA: hypothetical protein VHG92_03845 [Afifellaceae bacterium]|nr:hypothetical protein [Afifellaceae bacterium]